MLERDLGDIVKRHCDEHNIHYVPEYGGHDIVVQYHNIIFGIQLKLKLNVRGIAQSIETNGVDFKILLVANIPIDKDLVYFCYHSKVIPMIWVGDSDNFEIIPSKNYKINLLYFRQHPNKRLKLPPYKFDIPAGSRSPLTISDWKIAVCKLAILAKSNGGWIQKNDLYQFGLKNIPRYYFQYNSYQKRWDMIRSPLDDYKHIAIALEK